MLLSGLLLALLMTAGPAAGQSLNELNDLLGGGGGGSPLVPSRQQQQAEPQLTFTLTPEGPLQAGSTLTLAIQLELAEGAYTYSQDPGFGGNTKIAVAEVYGLEAIEAAFTPDHSPKVAYEELFEQDVQKFTGGVTWTRQYRYTGNVPADQIYLAGKISYQVCDAQNCRPLHEEFEVFPGEPVEGTPAQPRQRTDAAPMTSGPLPAESSTTPPSDVPPLAMPDREPSMRAAITPEEMGEAEDPLVFNIASKADEASLPWYLLMAFGGGLILNIMPCVLPVLAIKVMSFVQQAGESRGRVLALNISYSLGVIAVFLVLASLAVTLQIGWGGLFQKPEFQLAMIGLVFAMGLSMLGVFEIPIPGMIGSAGGQHREGLLGAFLIGIFATLLATPCSGPLMTSVLAWSVKQEPNIVYLIWGVMGLGMASPFLIVGMVPALAKFIPRPGDWMVRFKEFSGFALLAAVLWLMNALPAEVILPTLVMLLGLGIGLWMVGSLYEHSSSLTRRMSVRFYALLVAGVIGWFGWAQYLQGRQLAESRRSGPSVAAIERSLRNGGSESENEVPSQLPWETFSGERLTALLREGKPVLIDFTADWCAICKQNEKFALNTQATSRFVRENGVITLYADWTREDEEIRQWLDKFGSISVPLTVIFKQGDPQNPTILDGPYTQSTLLAYLQQAVPQNVAGEQRQSALASEAPRK
jgi:suppressor for copper-sensitivity B